jgi:hypothetical protein
VIEPLFLPSSPSLIPFPHPFLHPFILPFLSLAAPQKSVVNNVVILDQRRQEILSCLQRCVERFTKAILQSERNSSFDELTASLGDDVEPRVGAEGWRREGKKGFRTCLISLLNSLHLFAMVKQRLRSLLEICKGLVSLSFSHLLPLSLLPPSPYLPLSKVNGIDWSLVSDPAAIPLSELVIELAPLVNLRQVHSRDDWSLRWGGRDIGSYVLHRYIPLPFSLPSSVFGSKEMKRISQWRSGSPL